LAKFLFSLETLLQHRERIEQRERDELFRISYKYQVEQNLRSALLARLDETMKELARKRAENQVDQEMSWFYLYINRLGQEIKESEKRLQQLDAEVQAQKGVVVEATKERKTLTSLKTKQEQEFNRNQEKQEQKEVDELVVTRFPGKELGSERLKNSKSKNSANSKRERETHS
jgi:flagellar protein FliJ